MWCMGDAAADFGDDHQVAKNMIASQEHSQTRRIDHTVSAKKRTVFGSMFFSCSLRRSTCTSARTIVSSSCLDLDSPMPLTSCLCLEARCKNATHHTETREPWQNNE